MEQVGLVKNLVGDKAVLEIQRSGACGSCNACGSAESKAHIVTLKNTVNAKVGDKVELEGQSKNLFKYTLIVYLIPLVFLVAGIALGHIYFKSQGNPNYELLSFGIGLVFLGIAGIVVKFIDGKISKNDEKVIIMSKIL